MFLGALPARADLSLLDDYPPPVLGRASYYGRGFAGRKTASGAVFRPEQLTAAHRFLPLGTKVRVTNLNNGRSVLVTINDRGPYIRGRHIDLSMGAARAIGMLGQGVARVQIDIL
jgi:rare lipoprotein A